MSFFLGIEVEKQPSGTMILKQAKYIRDLLKRASMVDAKPTPTPILSSPRLSATDGNAFENPSLYRSVVGGLQYATLTRPDIAYAVNKISQYMHSHTDVHWKAVKRRLRYLGGTIRYGALDQQAQGTKDLSLL
ncbi:uncharacterized protein LOC110265332 [Arachis ipaensis]|uniref:uncharacterized protein LOC110265332 n=1 Tax=Arachis ipaensis TaxID=130454 RepID=UPI000A2B9098|nr:uncharacterized protein LOC110265332 [Arachis ipaensis]